MDDPYSIKNAPVVLEAISNINKDNILETLTHLTTYYNRSATQQSGVKAARWLKRTFEDLALNAHREDTATRFVETGMHYRQPSLVTVIGKDIKASAVVIGAHMDTPDGRMPGAGDDGSGSACIMEVARVLLESNIPLQHPVYIIWYAAEERGLVGSQRVIADFISKDIPVKAVVQFDMTGFRRDRSDATMWVYKDYTHAGLTDFLAELIRFYIGVPVGSSKCGYGCSDHASWTAKGIPAVFPCEMDFDHVNELIHTSGDTMDRLTPEHMVNFTKLGLAFAIELAS